MRFVGLTGGIGSGKSTVAAMLRARGAVVIDSDTLAREVVEPGTPGFDAVRAAFGAGVVTEGRLDRAALATIVFADPDRRAELEAIVHPEVVRRVGEIVAAYADTDDVVVLDSPLLIETGRHRDVELVIVVSAEPETQIGRLVARGMDEADARARLAAQMPLAEKAEVADVVLDNEGTLEELENQVDRLWSDLTGAAG
ncbi:MAG TPA: dephospho-CoA kinase [Actinomycetota bacterium]|jgi:dephospho-CoA kinase